MQSNISGLMLNGWLIIIIVAVISLLAIVGTSIYVKQKNKITSLDDGSQFVINRQSLLSRYIELKKNSQFSKAISIAMENETQFLIEATLEETYKTVIPNPRARIVGMADGERLESLVEIRRDQMDAVYQNASQADSVGSSLFEGMPEGSWG